LSGNVIRVAAVDCGTNSIRLLVADVDAATGALEDVVRRMEIVRLGYGVDRTGVIAPDAMARTLAAAAEYAAQCRELGAQRVRFVATSASRDARNAAEFVEGVRVAFRDFGIEPEVVTGVEEARLSFIGATGDVAAQGISGPYLVVDIGGGSTEFVRGTESMAAALSVDIGCVRMTERHLRSDPPTAAEVAAATRDIDAAIDRAAQVVGLGPVRALVGLAGSVTTVAAHVLDLPAYDSEVIHLSRSTPARFHDAAQSLLGMPRAQRAALGFMHPGRVDVIGAGALVWDRVIDRVARDSGLGGDLPVFASEHDILDGIALTLAGR
jgi:exopolyphosphatase/guanosine-5'-triphosphate,3'-diphosphate pyrophosphatase